MFGKKYDEMNAIEKHYHNKKKVISIRGFIIFCGVIFSGKMIMDRDQASELNFIQRTFICLLIVYF